MGIEYGEDRAGKDRSRKKRLVRNKPVKDRSDRPHRPHEEKDLQNSTIETDSPADGREEAEGPTTKDRPPENPIDKGNMAEADGRNGVDDDLQTRSNPSPEQQREIDRLIETGFGEYAARVQVLAPDHPLDCECGVCG